MIGSWCAGSPQALEPLPARQQFVAIALATVLLLLVLELVRRRRLREEYSWVWVAVAVVLIALALDDNLLITFSRWIGAASATSALFFGALLFLLLLVLQFSVRLSRLTHRHKTLGQRVALLERELERLQGRAAEPQSNGPQFNGPQTNGVVPLRTPPPVGSAHAERRQQDSSA